MTIASVFYLTPDGLILLFGLIVIAITAGLVLNQIRQSKDKAKAHSAVAAARKKILADGTVEGPKDRYVAHRKWKNGRNASRARGPYTRHAP